MSKIKQSNLKLAQSYNELPYTSQIYSNSQPVRLHAIAKMKGFDPVPLETAKVLEIGCSFGANLLPFAIQYPNAELVGIDLSEHQINIGKQMMEYVGVKNIELVSADICNISFNTKFDYIICHGVFSWVPKSVRQAILKTIQNYLSPNGVAYVSYNTYPGWKIYDIAKELMQFGSNPNLHAMDQVDQSLGILNFTSNILQRKGFGVDKIYANVFKSIIERQKYYIQHEFLTEFNSPLYFKDFIHQISQYDLGYLADSALLAIIPRAYFENEEYERICEYFGERLDEIEQFIDFLNNTTFRESIIARKKNLLKKRNFNNIKEYNNCYNFYDIYFKAHINYIPEKDNKVAYWEVNDKIQFIDTKLNNLFFTYLKKQKKSCKVIDVINNIMQNAECRMQNAECRMQNAECRMQNAECRNIIENLILSIIYSPNTYLCFSSEEYTNFGYKPELFEPYRKFIEFTMYNPNIASLFDKFHKTIKLDFLSQHIAKYLDGTKNIEELIAQIKFDIENKIIFLYDPHGTKISDKDITYTKIKEIIMENLELFRNLGYFNKY